MININPQWLSAFVTRNERRSFTRAAEKRGITQAAVSQHLRYLETRFGLLIVRKKGQFDLTPTGKVLLDYCREIGQADERLALRLTENDEDHGDISLITPGSIGLRCYSLYSNNVLD